jgi:hypothetical protein
MDRQINQNYDTPTVVIMNIVTEQCILNGSIENIGNRNEDIDW